MAKETKLGRNADVSEFLLQVLKKKINRDVISLQVLSIDRVKRWTALRFRKKEADADVPRTCILFFGQQEPSKAVARED